MNLPIAAQTGRNSAKLERPLLAIRHALNNQDQSK